MSGIPEVGTHPSMWEEVTGHESLHLEIKVRAYEVSTMDWACHGLRGAVRMRRRSG